jgi:cyclase
MSLHALKRSSVSLFAPRSALPFAPPMPVPFVGSRQAALPSARAPAWRALVVVALALRVAAAEAQEASEGMRVQRLRPTVHVVSGYENGNVLVVASDTGLLLVDAQSARRVAALDSAVRRVGARPVRLVINSHYHADHTEGNAFYRQLGADVLAHRNARLQAAKDTIIADWEQWHRTPLAEAAMPTRDVGDSLQFVFGDERVIVLHAPHAHTDGDLMVWLPRANVLHIGDILEVGAPPFVDWWSGGSISGMIAAIDRVLALVNDSTAIVPGHGAVSTRDDLRRYRGMLATVTARVAADVAKGETVDAVLAGHPAREWEAALGGDRRSTRFVQLVFYGVSRGR